MNYIFDSHTHYDDKAYDRDRDVLLSELKEKGVDKVVNISASLNDIEKIVKLADKYEFMWMTTGIHPSETYKLADRKCIAKKIPCFDRNGNISGAAAQDDMNADNKENITILNTKDSVIKYLEESVKYKKVKAIGEIGLDYHYDDTDKKCQKEWFEAQIEIAHKYKLPVVIHSREAAQDTYDVLKSMKAEELGGVIHCFSYEIEMAKRFMDLGYYIGVGGVLTFKNARKLKEIVEYMPMELMLLETDCPYLAPTPFRGERNDSTMIKYVVDEINHLKNIKHDDIRRITNENACRLYRI